MRKLFAVAAASALTLAMSTTAFAAAWKQDKTGQWRYMTSDSTWLTSTTTPDGYQVNADGQWITYGQIRRVYSTAATREAVRTANDKTYRPREAVRNHGKDGSFDEDTGKRVGGPESPFTQQTF